MTLNPSNLFQELPNKLSSELVEILAQSESVRIEKIVSTGQRSPDTFWYDQEEHEWVIVLRGEARLELEGQTELLHLKPGDHVNLPAHCRHRVDWTLPDTATVWLAVFYRAN